MGGRLVSLLTSVLFGKRVTDEPTCYKVFTKDVIDNIKLKCKRFEFCPEVTDVFVEVISSMPDDLYNLINSTSETTEIFE